MQAVGNGTIIAVRLIRNCEVLAVVRRSWLVHADGAEEAAVAQKYEKTRARSWAATSASLVLRCRRTNPVYQFRNLVEHKVRLVQVNVVPALLSDNPLTVW